MQPVTQEPRVAGIDLAKGLGILGVVVTHSISLHSLHPPLILDWTAGMGIGVLIACMGVVTGIRISSLARSVTYQGYRAHLRKRARRLVPAFALAWLAALTLGVLSGGLIWGPATLAGMLPVPGPGSYFVPVVAQWVLLEPFVALAYTKMKHPAWLLLGGLVTQWAWWRAMGGFERDLHFWIWGCILGLIGLMVGGVFVGARLRNWHPRTLTAAFLLVAAAGLGLLPGEFPKATWQLVSSLRAVSLTCGVLAAAVHVSPGNPLVRVLMYVGRASWHIFLVNLVYFGSVPSSGTGALGLFVDLAVCTGVGVVWFLVEQVVAQRAKALTAT